MTSGTQLVDALVLGAGPAGLALAYELSLRGVDVLCVSPELTVWKPVYGMFLDEVASLDLPFDRVWKRALVSFPDRSSHVLDRPYGRLDRAALFERWSSRLIASGQWRAGAFASALFSADLDEVRLVDGSIVRANQVFDATGHAARVIKRSPLGQGYQAAYGAEIASYNTPLGQETMGLMLWDNGLYIGGAQPRVATFNYVMPLSTKISFVERTVLAARTLIHPDTIANAPLSDRGQLFLDGHSPERCIIPLGYDVPDLTQRRVGFGGAASMVHPATGYMVARVLRTAPRVADAFVVHRNASPETRARALWRAIWSAEQVRTHAMYRFGLEVVLRLTPEQTWDFFDAFFELPEPVWRPYLSGTATVEEVTQLMWRVFAVVPRDLKRTLITTTLSSHGWTLWDGVLGGRRG